MTVAGLQQRFRDQARQCRLHGSPLTAALLTGAADELAIRGPVADLLQPLAGDPRGGVPSLRFAGARHRLVLERRAPALARHYPSVGGSAPPEQVWPAAREAVAEHRAELARSVRRPVQTNEVGRSAALYGGLLRLTGATGRPVRLLEIGASGGLNLRVEHFAYETAAGVLGDPRSPVRLQDPWRGRAPDPGPLTVVERTGCDPAPLDPTSEADRLTLTSYVWADQVDRLDRLRGAMEVAARVPATVTGEPASAFLQRELAEPVPDAVTVVWQSVVRQYLAPDERERVTALLAQAGARASPEAPLAWLALEPEQVGAGEYAFRLTLTTWPGGEHRVLADCLGHGPPVTWR
ncbi:MAG: hypothetical protein JWN57_142 [Frankiales bacterium]|nr:hypothetical protein [Frankiales bacterium]